MRKRKKEEKGGVEKQGERKKDRLDRNSCDADAVSPSRETPRNATDSSRNQ